MTETDTPDSNTDAAGHRGRRVLIALFGLFLAPVLVAVFLNSQWTDWQPQPTRQHGRLIQPVLPLGPNGPAGAGDDPGTWRLLVPVAAACDAACESRLMALERVRRSLGRHQDDLRLVVVSASPVRPALESVAVWHDAAGYLDDRLASRGLAAEGLFLVDPLGNLMMHFPPPEDLGGLSKDVDRLVSNTRFQ